MCACSQSDDYLIERTLRFLLVFKVGAHVLSWHTTHKQRAEEVGQIFVVFANEKLEGIRHRHRQMCIRTTQAFELHNTHQRVYVCMRVYTCVRVIDKVSPEQPPLPGESEKRWMCVHMDYMRNFNLDNRIEHNNKDSTTRRPLLCASTYPRTRIYTHTRVGTYAICGGSMV